LPFFIRLCFRLDGLAKGRGFHLNAGISHNAGSPNTFLSPQGNSWLSQVPRLPLWLHALVSDPGGVLTARHIASRAAAFRHHNNVGFHSRSPGRCPMTTMSKISGLHTRPAALIHPASDSCYQVCPRTSLLTCWLDFSQVGFSRLTVEITHWVTLSSFIPLGGNPNDLDLAWRDVISCHAPRYLNQ